MRYKQGRLVVLLCMPMLLIACAATQAPTNKPFETFSFDVAVNHFRVIIPELPQIHMHDHPLAASRPDFRYMGEDPKSGYNISILTPTADKGMTPEQCATASYKNLLKRYELDEKYVARRKNNASTFVVMFPYRTGPLIQFQAYVLSGYGGDHCIDVHISKVIKTKSKDELKHQLFSWYRSFTGASIERY